ncbi:MAG: hypothetical protein J1D86_08130 [Alistipes sp.]|nr:hypothetical protein [Alistipes sp.]
MKKLLFVLMAALAMTSCSTVKKTATIHNVKPRLEAAVLTDLDVSNQKITYTYIPTNKVRRGGAANCINTAIHEALLVNGGDVLIETQTATVEHSWTRKIKSVTVTGYPAKYKNFRPADDKTLKESLINSAYGIQTPTDNAPARAGFLKLFGK